jgi:hypothetical protein
LQMGPSASMVGRQPRHRHKKHHFVHRGSHPCLDRNIRYYRIATTAHLAVIASFLSFCQQSSPCASVNVRRVHRGPSSPVLIQSSRDRSLICQYIGPFVSLWVPEMGFTSEIYQLHVPPGISKTSWSKTACHSFDRIFRLISVPQ